MDRKMIYPGQIPLETDLLDTNRFAMIGLGKLAAAVLGTTTLVNGLACTPTSPASMQVQVAPGEIYSLQNIDGTAYSSLASDTTHQILKQGLLMDAITLNCPAPITNGYSINYLVQATYQDTDTNAVVLPYYNASNPTQAYSGPTNSGTAQNTVRKGMCTVSVKAGISATTGSQQTPSPDVGYVSLYSVTVSSSQTTITVGNIASVSNAPFINSTLFGSSPSFTSVPTSQTPSQFDNSSKIATTAFMKSAGESFGGVKVIAGATVLDATYAGQLTVFTGTTYAATLPASATYPAGTTLTFYSAASGVVTLNRTGSDVVSVNNSSSVTSISLGSGDTLTLVSNGSGIWDAVSGSAQLQYAANFASNKATNGYQKLPTGLIIQWGTVNCSATTYAVSYPIAFPNSSFSVITQLREQSTGTFPTAVFASGASVTGFTLFLNGYTSGTITSNYIAIGY